MDRRDFLRLSAASLAGLGLSGTLPPQAMGRCKKNDAYNIIILGDTHFDTEPADVYHSHYNEPTEWLNRIQRAEFARNGDARLFRGRDDVRRPHVVYRQHRRRLLKTREEGGEPRTVDVRTCRQRRVDGGLHRRLVGNSL